MEKTAIHGMFLRAEESISSREWLHTSRIIEDLALSFAGESIKLAYVDGQNTYDTTCSMDKLIVYKIVFDDEKVSNDENERLFEQTVHYLFEAIKSNTRVSIDYKPFFFDDVLVINHVITSEECARVYLNFLDEKYRNRK